MALCTVVEQNASVWALILWASSLWGPKLSCDGGGGGIWVRAGMASE